MQKSLERSLIHCTFWLSLYLIYQWKRGIIWSSAGKVDLWRGRALRLLDCKRKFWNLTSWTPDPRVSGLVFVNGSKVYLSKKELWMRQLEAFLILHKSVRLGISIKSGPFALEGGIVIPTNYFSFSSFLLLVSTTFAFSNSLWTPYHL